MVLTLYSELDCQGQSAVIKDKEVNLAKAGVKFHVKVNFSYWWGWSRVKTFIFSNLVCISWREPLDIIFYRAISGVFMFSRRWKVIHWFKFKTYRVITFNNLHFKDMKIWWSMVCRITTGLPLLNWKLRVLLTLISFCSIYQDLKVSDQRF